MHHRYSWIKRHVCDRIHTEPRAHQHESSKKMKMSTTKERIKKKKSECRWLAGWHDGERKVRRNRGNNFSNKSLFMNNSIFVLAEVRRCVYARQVFVCCVHELECESVRMRGSFFEIHFPFACAEHSHTFQCLTLFPFTHTQSRSPPPSVSQSFENNSRYKYLMKNIRKVVKSLQVPHWRRRRRETIWPKLASSFSSTKQYVRSPLCSYHVRALRRFHKILKRRLKNKSNKRHENETILC